MQVVHTQTNPYVHTQAHPQQGQGLERFMKANDFCYSPLKDLDTDALDAIARAGKAVFELQGQCHHEDIEIPDFIPGSWRVKWLGLIGSPKHGRLVLVPGSPRCTDAWLEGRIKNMMALGYTEEQSRTIMDLKNINYKDTPEVAQAVQAALADEQQRLHWSKHWAISSETEPGSGPFSWRARYGRIMPYRLAERHERSVAEILDAISPMPYIRLG